MLSIYKQYLLHQSCIVTSALNDFSILSRNKVIVQCMDVVVEGL